MSGLNKYSDKERRAQRREFKETKDIRKNKKKVKEDYTTDTDP